MRTAFVVRECQNVNGLNTGQCITIKSQDMATWISIRLSSEEREFLALDGAKFKHERRKQLQKSFNYQKMESFDPGMTTFSLTHMSQLRERNATLFKFKTHAAKHSTIHRGTPKNAVLFLFLLLLSFLWPVSFPSLSLSRFRHSFPHTESLIGQLLAEAFAVEIKGDTGRALSRCLPVAQM